MLRINRRACLAAAAGFLGVSGSGWLPVLAERLAADPRRRRHCVLLWMPGGPSQTDTFDMKPNHANGGSFAEIATAAAGLRWSEHLPQLARHAPRLAVVRSLSTQEGDHGRATYLARTGHQPLGAVAHPAIGSSLSKELSAASLDIPAYVSISPYLAFNRAAFGPGFLGPSHAPLTVGQPDGGSARPETAGGYAQLRVDDLQPPGTVASDQFGRRVRFWRELQRRFLRLHETSAATAHQTVYERALKLIGSDVARAFDLSEEPDRVREAYGRGRFGQGCLMARRLIERGVPFVEISLGRFAGGAVAWDTHRDNFTVVEKLSRELDAGWATLMTELSQRGLLEATTIVWLGEFGRTPQINNNAGRDHFPRAWSCVLAGGGIRGGQPYGRTTDDGMEVAAQPVGIPDVLATLCTALGVSPDKENVSDLGRPMRIAEGKPIADILSDM